MAVRPLRTGRTYGPYVRLVRTVLGMIGMLAGCSSLPCGELFSATTYIAHDSDIPTINTLPIMKIAVAYFYQGKVTDVQACRTYGPYVRLVRTGLF